MTRTWRRGALVLVPLAWVVVLAAGESPDAPRQSGVPASVADTPASSLDRLYEELRAPVVTGVLPTPPTLQVGHAEITPGAGARLLALSAGTRPCGWLLEGPATVVYRVGDRYALPVARRNLGAARGLDLVTSGDELLVKTVVQGVVAWTWDALPDVAQAVDTREVALPPWLREDIDKGITVQPAVGMLLAARNGGAGLAWAILHRAEDLLLGADPRPAAALETLRRIRPAANEAWSAEELAAQPIGRSWLDTPRVPFITVDTELDMSNPAGATLRVSARTRVRFLVDGMTVLPMTLWGGFRDDSRAPRGFRISTLKVDGGSAGFVHRDGRLLVELSRPMRRDDTVVLDLDAQGDIVPRTSEPNEHWRLAGDWYPRPQPYGLEFAEIRLTAALPPPLLPLVAGAVEERTVSGGLNRVRTRLPGPTETGIVVAGRYSTLTRELNGRRVQVSTLVGPLGADLLREGTTRLATTVIAVQDCLERWLGVPSPFPEMQIIETAYGTHYAPGIVFVESGDFKPVRQLGQTGTTHRIAREVAHSWFPHVAKITSPEDAWLGDSLADYTSAHCLAQVDPRQGGRLFETRLGEWKSASDAAGRDTSLLLAEHLGNTDRDLAARADLLHGRGPLVIHGVRVRLTARFGDEAGTSMFLTWIRSYVKNFTYKPANTRAFIALLEKITGERWLPYFEQYLLGTDSAPVR